MKRGAKPKPTYLRIINGNPRDKPLNLNEPIPTGNLHEAPAWLNSSQKEGWNYAIEHAPPGLLKHLDRSILTIWVIAEDCHRQASQKVNEVGMLIKAPNTGLPIQSPYMAIQNKQAHIMMNAAAQLGFTPSSRSQISVEAGRGNAFSNNGRRA
jgi:P27 family predicted phage terminase small subunit